MQHMGTTGAEEAATEESSRDKAVKALSDTLVMITGRMPPLGACDSIIDLIVAAVREPVNSEAAEAILRSIDPAYTSTGQLKEFYDSESTRFHINDPTKATDSAKQKKGGK